MKYDIYAKHLDITKGMRQHIDEKMEKLNKFFHPEPEEVKVTLKVENNLHKAELTLFFGETVLRTEQQTTDMYGSIDSTITKMERQLRKYHTKIKQKSHQKGLRNQVKAYAQSQETQTGENDYQLARTKQILPKPMSVQDALLEMDLIGHDFYVFLNQDTEKTNVVYRRKNGKNGLIETM